MKLDVLKHGLGREHSVSFTKLTKNSFRLDTVFGLNEKDDMMNLKMVGYISAKMIQC